MNDLAVLLEVITVSVLTRVALVGEPNPKTIAVVYEVEPQHSSHRQVKFPHPGLVYDVHGRHQTAGN